MGVPRKVADWEIYVLSPTMFKTLPFTRKQARQLECKYYSTRKACMRGHIAIRDEKSGSCQQCNQTRYRSKDNVHKMRNTKTLTVFGMKVDLSQRIAGFRGLSRDTNLGDRHVTSPATIYRIVELGDYHDTHT